MKKLYSAALCAATVLFIAMSCDSNTGAKGYDPDTPVVQSQYPEISSFAPTQAKAGEAVTIYGVNFETATAVTFGGKSAESFEIQSDSVIVAVVSQYGASGAVAVTNHKGTESLDGFKFIKEEAPVASDNMALNAEVSCSATEAGSIYNVVDGDETTFWQAGSADHEWFIIDLGKLCNFNTVEMTMDPGACPTAYEILVSEDGSSYTSVFKATGYNPSSDNGIHASTFDKVAARYVKVDMTECVNVWFYTIYEAGVYLKTGGSDPEPTTPDTNLAEGKDTDASSKLSNSYPGSNATDGDANTFWQANGAESEWLRINFGGSVTFNTIVITWDPGACATGFAIQTSYDGQTFSTVKTIEGYDPTADGGIQTIELGKNIQTCWLKLDLTANIGPWNYTIKEVEVYCK